MVYEVDKPTILFGIKRSEIIDISVGDKIRMTAFGGIDYTWTQQDGNLVENNPYDDLFLRVERDGENYKATGIVFHSNKPM